MEHLRDFAEEDGHLPSHTLPPEEEYIEEACRGYVPTTSGTKPGIALVFYMDEDNLMSVTAFVKTEDTGVKSSVQSSSHGAPTLSAAGVLPTYHATTFLETQKGQKSDTAETMHTWKTFLPTLKTSGLTLEDPAIFAACVTKKHCDKIKRRHEKGDIRLSPTQLASLKDIVKHRSHLTSRAAKQLGLKALT